ncbi:mechanosensitive ion channel [Palleronia sediminis]|uniref:Mechanosensitive ion channel n=1 Tax=Palleronia sediminis TaxID=2547833 RepID=A0A4R6A9Z7_9RHOB|nr:mechanosensitive ion channel domain-containing protein [Palleronia sediminis]TDL79534.1 mechanosensitive ion channel [Palleronia sediminis]
MRVLAILVALVAALALPARAQEGASGPVGTYFEIDALNAGLGAPPDTMQRDTPQSAVESFLDAVDRDDYAAAAHMLDLREIPAVEQATRGPELARKLKELLDRRAILTWRTLLERPDALNAQLSSNATMAGEPRRSLLLGVLDRGPRETAIRLNRLRVGEEPPVWVFSSETVTDVPALYELYGPTRLENALPPWLKIETPMGLRLWEVIGLPVIAIGAALAGWLVWLIFDRLSRVAQWGWARLVLRALRWPSIILAVATMIVVASQHVFTFPGLVTAIVTPVSLLGYVAAVLIFAITLIDEVLDRIVTFDSDALADSGKTSVRAMATLMTAGRRIVIVLAVIVGVGIVLASSNVFRSLGFSLLASAGALTLVFGFAGRQVLGNILASLQIAMNRSARIGDRVIYEGYFSTVERIHFTFVQLRIWNGNRLVVPVAEFVSGRFENWSMTEDGMTISATLTLHHHADIDAMRKRFFELCEEEDEITPKDQCAVHVMSQDAFGQKVRFQAPVPDPDTCWPTETAMRERLIAAAQRMEAETGRPVLPEIGFDQPG